MPDNAVAAPGRLEPGGARVCMYIATAVESASAALNTSAWPCNRREYGSMDYIYEPLWVCPVLHSSHQVNRYLTLKVTATMLSLV